jgi:hypothetical protein
MGEQIGAALAGVPLAAIPLAPHTSTTYQQIWAVEHIGHVRTQAVYVRSEL